jgi:hypothetical protein
MAQVANSFTERRPSKDDSLQEILEKLCDHRRTFEFTALASGARTTTTFGGPFINHDCPGGVLFLNITVASGTGGLQVAFVGIDPVSGLATQLMALPAAIIATGQYPFFMYPGLTGFNVAANVKQNSNLVLPRQFYTYVYHGDASSYTYSLGCCLIP